VSELLDQGLELLAAAAEFHEAAYTPGARVEVPGGSIYGEGSLERSREVRDAALGTLLGSMAVSLDRAATALQAIADAGGGDGRGDLERFSTAELSAELAERLKGEAGG
jgi:hypothetical protein